MNWCKWFGHAWLNYSLSKNNERTVTTNKCKRCGLIEQVTDYSDVLKDKKVEFFR